MDKKLIIIVFFCLGTALFAESAFIEKKPSSTTKKTLHAQKEAAVERRIEFTRLYNQTIRLGSLVVDNSIDQIGDFAQGTKKGIDGMNGKELAQDEEQFNALNKKFHELIDELQELNEHFRHVSRSKK